MPRVGSSRSSTRGPVASHLPITTFCWLPPESVAATCSMPVQRTPRRRTASPATRASARAERMPKRERRDSDGRVTLSRIEASRCRPLALRSSVTSAMPRRRASRGEATVDRRAGDADLAAAAAAAGAEQRLEDLGAAGAEQAGDAEHLAGADLEADAVEDALPAVAGGQRRARGRGPRAPARRPAVRRTRTPASGWRPTIAAIIRLRSISPIGAVTTWRPSRSTVTRSASSATSSRRWEM